MHVNNKQISLKGKYTLNVIFRVNGSTEKIIYDRAYH